MTAQQVKAAMGKPLSVAEEKADGVCHWQTGSTLTYRNLLIFIADGVVDSITTTSKTYATKEGIRVGDPITKAQKIYSSKFGGEQIIDDSEEYSLSYVNSSYGGISFNADKRGIITKIHLLSSSC
jgi:hypothetical protein